MEPIFNKQMPEELVNLYRNIMIMQNHNIACMFAALQQNFQPAAVPPDQPSIEPGSVIFNTSNISLNSDIPREEIECDPEIIVVKNLRENLRALNTNLNGFHGKKFGFREVVEMASIKQAYPISPSVAFKKKRSRFSMENSILHPLETSTNSPLTTSSDAKENSVKKICHGLTSDLDDSTASSHDGKLIIDCDENISENFEVKTEPQIDEANGEAEVMVTEPEVQINEQDATIQEYKPARLRIERLKNIQKKKPKFSIDTLELTYHSNMARRFPGSENRTEDQQERRTKNTLAARISRTKSKAYEAMLEENAVSNLSNNINMKRKIACLRVYASSLMKINGIPDTNFSQMWEANIKDIVSFSK